MQDAFGYRRPPSPRSRSKYPKRTAKTGQPLPVTYGLWIVDFLLNKATTGHVVWSNSESRFASKPGSFFQAQRYLDHSEMFALCNLLGANGMVFVEAKLLDLAESLIVNLRVRFSSECIIDVGNLADIFYSHY
jgi:hypothetical protein